MNLQLPAQIILALSFLGLAVIVAKKIPVLAELDVSQNSGEGRFLKLKKKIQEANPLKGTGLEVFLQKILSKIRVWSLRADNKATDWIQVLRKRIEKKNNFFQIFPERNEKSGQSLPSKPKNPAGEGNMDNYWQDIKTSVAAKSQRKNHSKKSKKK